MSNPVLVRAYDPSPNDSPRNLCTPRNATSATAPLPPLSSFAFGDVLRQAQSQCPQLQQAIDGIAQIYAKNRLSLADEYSSHLPPVGVNSGVRSHLLRPGLRPALTSVPEGSSGSSGGSKGSRKSKGKSRSKSKSQEQDQHNLSRFGWNARTGGEKATKKLGFGTTGPVVPVRPADVLLETPFAMRSCVALGDEQNENLGRAASRLRRILALYLCERQD